MSYDGRRPTTVGEPTARRLKELTLAIYQRAGEIAARARDHPGRHQVRVRPAARARDELVLGDEVLTPDSSRFWPADRWEPGHAQPSFDKQYVRDWLLSPRVGLGPGVRARSRRRCRTRWWRRPAQRYVEAYERLTGLRFADWTG